MSREKFKQVKTKPDAFIRSDVSDDPIPHAIQGQNLGHNSKKEALGPNTKRSTT